MRKLNDTDIERVKDLATINHAISRQIEPSVVWEHQVEAICGYIRNYSIINGREATVKLLEANIKGYEDESISIHADAMHEAYLMFFDLEDSVVVAT